MVEGKELKSSWKATLSANMLGGFMNLVTDLASQSQSMNKDTLSVSDGVVGALKERLTDKENTNPEGTEESLLKAQENALRPVLEREKTIQTAVTAASVVVAVVTAAAVGYKKIDKS